MQILVLLSPKHCGVNMDVVLWNDCPYPHKSLGLVFRYSGPYKIAHYVREHGYTTQIIDYVTTFTEEELLEFTLKFVNEETLVLGFSTTFISQHEYSHGDTTARITEPMLNVLKTIKSKFPKIKIILGGHMSDKVSGWGIVDGVVTGYGEDTFLELLNHYKTKSPAPLFKLNMSLWANKVVRNYYEAEHPKYDIAKDNFKFTKQDCILPNDTLPLELSRGCIFKCKFCAFPLLGRGKLDYLRSMDCVKDELIYNYEQFGVTNYYVLCDTFNDTEYKISEWHKMVTSLPFKINYTAYLRADLLHRFPDMVYQLHESGLIGAYHGLESLHPEASSIIGKGWSGKGARDFIPELYHNKWKGEVAQHLNFIVGLPKDTPESMLDTVKWYKQNNLHSISFDPLSMSAPDKTRYNALSEFEKDASKYGFTFDNEGWWKNNEWTEQSAISFAQDLNKLTKNVNKMNSWTIMSFLSLGFSKAELLNLTRSQFPWRIAAKGKRDYLKRYKDALRKL